MIATLQAMVLALQATTPSTPPSQQRFRKKRKPKTPESVQNESVLEDSESDNFNDELHELHAITAFQSESMEQISFIEHPTDITTVDDDLLKWDDLPTDSEDESMPSLSPLDT
jgi:hypothetical protein